MGYGYYEYSAHPSEAYGYYMASTHPSNTGLIIGIIIIVIICLFVCAVVINLKISQHNDKISSLKWKKHFAEIEE